MTQLSKAQKADYLKKKLSSQVWRLNNLYFIKNAQGQKIRFNLNWAQRDFYNNLHYFNTILKARQLGFTTFSMIYFLDCCLFQASHSAGVIAHTREDAEDLFKNKIRYAYDNLDDWVKSLVKATQDSSRRLEFSNGSTITVGTSLRSGTYQKLLISEYGKIAARYPEKAKEIKTGALNTVHIGQQIFVESTAEGNQGEFFELCERARKLKELATELTRLDPKFHFYPWFKHPDYVLNKQEIANTSIDIKMQEYFESLQIDLTPAQKAWYVKKSEQQGDEMKREFPSTPKESFEQSMEGAIYVQQMSLVRKNKQIGHIPHEPSQPVYTFWDLGKGGADCTAIWFFQHIGNQYRFIDYHESNGEAWGFYAKLLNSKPYVYSEHVLPHDGDTVKAGLKSVTTTRQDLEVLGVRPIRCVPRTLSIWGDIKGACKSTLPRCWFDDKNCAQGIKHLDNYRKEWDDRLATWKEKPRHDDASHGADSFRTFAIGYTGRKEEFIDYSERQQFADTDYDILDY